MRTRLATLLLLMTAISGCSEEPVIVQLEDLVVSSDTFAEGEEIPAVHTCDGEDTPPSLTWSGVPDGTREIVLLVVDRQADGFVHWAAAGIDPAATTLEGAVQGTNSFGDVGYGGPCPPPGDDPHEYVFNVYSLGRGTGLDEGFAAEELQEALSSANGAGQVVGTYSRQ